MPAVIGFALWDRTEMFLTTWYLCHPTLFCEWITDAPKIDSLETALAESNVQMYKNCTDPTASKIDGLDFSRFPAAFTPMNDTGLWCSGRRSRGVARVGASAQELRQACLGEGSIKLARDGFTVNEDLAAALNSGKNPDSLKLCGLS